jgi:acetyltransferase
MTIRNLDALFAPKSVAVIGASRKPGSVGSVVLRNLLRGGFAGPVMPVNPKADEIQGRRCYGALSKLPCPPDMAVVAVPPSAVAGVIGELGEIGCRGAVVLSAGFAELGEAGRAEMERILAAAKPHLLRLVGPNCLGLLSPGIGLDASFAHRPVKKGRIGFVSQSGAVMAAVMDWADARHIGFSKLVSLGEQADVDFGDMIDYLAADAETESILLYIEAVTHARKFMSAARAASRIKPVIAIKAGRAPEAAKAATSHTGALAGRDAVYDAAFRRAGVLRVTELGHLFDAVEVLGRGLRAEGDSLTILTNGGGFGVMATDTLIEQGGRLAPLSAETAARLDQVLPPTWSRANPIDIIGDADGARYAAALEAVLQDRETGALLVINCPTAIADSGEAASAVAEALAAAPRSRPPVLASWVGADDSAKSTLRRAGLPCYDTPDDAVRGFMHLARHHRAQDQLMQTPPSVPEEFIPDRAAARAILDEARAAERLWLGEDEAKRALAAYGIPVVETRPAASPAEAAALAAEMGGPVALKIRSPDITHKSEHGGVVLDLSGPEAVEAAAEAMLARLSAARPEARLDGFTVQRMARRGDALELILGLSCDPQFGPVVMFGAGGVAVEALRDTALALPPLNMSLARELIGRTRVFSLLKGYRDRPPCDIDALAVTLIKLAQLAADLPGIAELDINPLLATPGAVVALDARLRLARPGEPASGGDSLAIKPYPAELEESFAHPVLGEIRLRPVRPEDEPLLTELMESLTPEDARLRFFSPIRRLPHRLAARLTQIDYDREMALVALPAEGGRMLGIARITADPDFRDAEFAITIRSELKRKGLGRLLLGRLVSYGASRGLARLHGDVLPENAGMLGLAKSLGFSPESVPGAPEQLRVGLMLSET